MRGPFLSFEGIDGSGKSTQLERCCAWLASGGHDLVRVREPGGTRLGERVRELLLDPATGDIAPAAEALLYAASRAELVATVVRPALEAGRVVVADRFLDSSIAYQGAGRRLGADRVLGANLLATGDLWPDLTVLVRVPADVAAARLAATGDGLDRIEREQRDFFERVVDAYDRLAAEHPARVLVVDGTRSPDEVFAQVQGGVARLVDAGATAASGLPDAAGPTDTTERATNSEPAVPAAPTHGGTTR